MAGIDMWFQTGDVSLSAGVAKTVLQIVAAANHRDLLKRLEIFFKGTVSGDAPVRIRLIRQTTAGTMTSLSPVKHDESVDETLQTTGQKNATAEPTAGDVLRTLYIHPQTGMIEPLDFGDEFPIKGGTRLGVECLADQAQTVAINAKVEE